jgi:hypothetical protein
MRNNPCDGCTEDDGREIGCHSWCKEYIKWAKHNKDVKEEMRKDYDIYNYEKERRRA